MAKLIKQIKSNKHKNDLKENKIQIKLKLKELGEKI